MSTNLITPRWKRVISDLLWELSSSNWQSLSPQPNPFRPVFELATFHFRVIMRPWTETLHCDVGSSWEITAYFRALPQGSSKEKEAQLWIPTDTKQWQQPPDITPIKSMSSEPLKVQLYLEHPNPCEPKKLQE